MVFNFGKLLKKPLSLYPISLNIFSLSTFNDKRNRQEHKKHSKENFNELAVRIVSGIYDGKFAWILLFLVERKKDSLNCKTNLRQKITLHAKGVTFFIG